MNGSLDACSTVGRADSVSPPDICNDVGLDEETRHDLVVLRWKNVERLTGREEKDNAKTNSVNKRMVSLIEKMRSFIVTSLFI